MMSTGPFGEDEARQLDAADPLSHLRDRFELPADVVYLDGNSLGPPPKTAKIAMQDVVTRQWGQDLVRSWNDHDWIGAPQRIGGKIATLMNADPQEVIVADSVSVNIFKLLTALVRQQAHRTKILTEAGNFPTDIHVAQGVADILSLKLNRMSREELTDHLDDRTAALLLSHVHYRTGQRFDMAAINAAARSHNVPVLWDLSHSTGAVPLDLKRDATQFAVGCGYKYLNGGPGAPAFVYVSADQQDAMRSPLQGWMGHQAPFAFQDNYQSAQGMNRFLVGTPPVLSLLSLECGVDEFTELNMLTVFEKSNAMFDFLVGQVASHCPQLKLITPTNENLRGSHVAYSHPHAWPINNALIARGVIGDFRTPDVLRFGLTPLYTRFEDLARAVSILAEIMSTEEWRKPEFSRKTVVT